MARLDQIIAAFDTPMANDVLRSDALHVRTDGNISLIREGVSALVLAALEHDRADVVSAAQHPGNAAFLQDTEQCAMRLPREFRETVLGKPADYTLLLDTPGGDALVFKALAQALTRGHRLGGTSAVFAGRKLESVGMLVGANAQALHALTETNILMHAPQQDWESLGLTESDLTPESLAAYREEQRVNAERMHAFVLGKVTGIIRRFFVNRKLAAARRDPANHRGEVAFRADELPGFVTEAHSDAAVLSAAFVERTGVEARTGIERPSDRFFTLLRVRQRIVRRLRETLGAGDILGMPNNGLQVILPMDKRHLGDQAARIVQEEVLALQKELQA